MATTSHNPISKTVSQFAATEIGQGRTVDARAAFKTHFKDEAAKVTEYLQGIHHARKLDFMQVGYGDTVNKLSKMQSEVPVILARDDESIHASNKVTSKNTISEAVKLRQWEEGMSKTIAKESHDNLMKRYENREKGRKATVNEIMSGRFYGPEKHGMGHDIFPQKVRPLFYLSSKHVLLLTSLHLLSALICKFLQ